MWRLDRRIRGVCISLGLEGLRAEGLDVPRGLSLGATASLFRCAVEERM